MRSEHQKRVDEFMRLAGQDVPETQTEPTVDVCLLRARLILEEALETITKGLGVSLFLETDDGSFPIGTGLYQIEFETSHPIDLVETIDGCCDLSVVTTGTLSAIGVPDTPFLEEVDANNLAKFGPGGYRDEHGKWRKPADHKPPRIAEILESLA